MRERCISFRPPSVCFILPDMGVRLQIGRGEMGSQVYVNVILVVMRMDTKSGNKISDRYPVDISLLQLMDMYVRACHTSHTSQHEQRPALSLGQFALLGFYTTSIRSLTQFVNSVNSTSSLASLPESESPSRNNKIIIHRLLGLSPSPSLTLFLCPPSPPS